MFLSCPFPACSNLQFKDFLSQELLAFFAFNSHWWTFLPLMSLPAFSNLFIVLASTASCALGSVIKLHSVHTKISLLCAVSLLPDHLWCAEWVVSNHQLVTCPLPSVPLPHALIQGCLFFTLESAGFELFSYGSCSAFLILLVSLCWMLSNSNLSFWEGDRSHLSRDMCSTVTQDCFLVFVLFSC